MHIAYERQYTGMAGMKRLIKSKHFIIFEVMPNELNVQFEHVRNYMQARLAVCMDHVRSIIVCDHRRHRYSRTY